jgi:excisionase family DNA binding protein
MDIPADLLTPAQAAALVGLDAASVRRWVRVGTVRGYRLGGPRGRIRVSRADLLHAVQVQGGDALQTKREHEASVEADRALLRAVGCV